MATFRKVKAGLVNQDITNFVGEPGNIFFNTETGELRLSDGITPGGLPIYNVGGLGSGDSIIDGGNPGTVFNGSPGQSLIDGGGP
jgi:hypothetical protein